VPHIDGFDDETIPPAVNLIHTSSSGMYPVAGFTKLCSEGVDVWPFRVSGITDV